MPAGLDFGGLPGRLRTLNKSLRELTRVASRLLLVRKLETIHIPGHGESAPIFSAFAQTTLICLSRRGDSHFPSRNPCSSLRSLLCVLYTSLRLQHYLQGTLSRRCVCTLSFSLCDFDLSAGNIWDRFVHGFWNFPLSHSPDVEICLELIIYYVYHT